MKVAVLVPRRADGGHRDHLWGFVEAHWEREHPRWQIVEGHHGEAEGPFNRSLAINRAAEAAGDWDVAVITDSDSFASPAQLVEAVRVADVHRRFTLAYTDYLYLSREGTGRILAGFDGAWEPFVEFSLDWTVSSMVVVSRQLWDMTGGFDPGFQGWAGEDFGFFYAAETLGGKHLRVPGPVWHLWHPKTGDPNPPTLAANIARMEQYRDAAGDPEAMAALCRELRPGWPNQEVQ